MHVYLLTSKDRSLISILLKGCDEEHSQFQKASLINKNMSDKQAKAEAELDFMHANQMFDLNQSAKEVYQLSNVFKNLSYGSFKNIYYAFRKRIVADTERQRTNGAPPPAGK